MIFTSVLLPAPFSPSNAWISPDRMARSTRSLARQPGNCLTMPVSCSSGAVPAAAATMADAIRSSPCEPSPAWPPRAFVRCRSDSVRNLVRFFQPFPEDAPGLLGLQMDEGHGATVDRLVELAIDVIVVEADGGRVDARIGIVD